LAAKKLTAELFNVVDHLHVPLSAMAEEAGIAPSTASRWKTGAVPRTFHAQMLGAAAGLRLEWEPVDHRWPGAERPCRTNRPEPLAMMGAPPPLVDVEIRGLVVDLNPVLFDAYLLSAEARWARIYSRVWSLYECPGDRHAWAAFEHGPEVRAAEGSSMQHRRFRSSPLATAVFVGRHVGLRLVWHERDELYRVRPWEVQDPPPARTITAALIEERRRRPRLL
jgi:hypothetical protein